MRIFSSRGIHLASARVRGGLSQQWLIRGVPDEEGFLQEPCVDVPAALPVSLSPEVEQPQPCADPLSPPPPPNILVPDLPLDVLPETALACLLAGSLQ